MTNLKLSNYSLALTKLLQKTEVELNSKVFPKDIEDILEKELVKHDSVEGVMERLLKLVQVDEKLKSEEILFQEITVKEYYKKIKEGKLGITRHKLRTGMVLWNEKFWKFGANYGLWKKLYEKVGGKYDVLTILKFPTIASKFSDEIKKIGPKCSKNADEWTLLSGINTLYGKGISEYTIDGIKKKIDGWVNNEWRPKYNGSTTEYYEKFRTATRKILNWKDTKINFGMDRDEYLLNVTKTGTTGSGYDPDKPFSDFSVSQFGEKLKYQKTKFTVSCGLTLEQKKRKMMSTAPSKSRVSVKKEEFYPKVRTIISSDYKTFLKMHYIQLWLSKWMHGNINSTLWMNKKQRFDMFMRMTNFDDQVAVPIDETAFDHKYTVEQFVIQMEEVRECIRMNESDEQSRKDLIETIDQCILSVTTGEILYEGNKWLWTSGLLSGWGLTADFNTLKNIAQKEVALDLLSNVYNFNINILLYNAQGDDQLVRTRTYREALAYYLALCDCGSEINYSKNFFSKDHDEYLRKVTVKGKLNGYLARAIDGMMWYDKYNKLNEVQKLNESYSSWQKIGNRIYRGFNDVKRFFVDDMLGSKIKIDKINNFLDLPRTLGGAGIKHLYGVSEIYDVIEVDEVESVPGLRIEGSGLKQFAERYLQNQRSGVKQWLQNSVKVISDKFSLNTESEHKVRINIKEKRVLVKEGVELSHAKYRRGWDASVIMSINDVVFNEAFSDLDSVLKRYRASKKFIYEWLIGRVSLALPVIDNMSSEMLSYFSQQYENSLLFAMLNKRIKGERPWERINLFYERWLRSKILGEYDFLFIGS